MKPRAGVLAFLVLLAACGSSSASSSTSSGASSGASSEASSSGRSSSGTTPGPAAGHCGPVGAVTLAASRRARVYSWHGSVYGCSFSGARSFRLGSTTRGIRESRVDPIAVAGNVAAYGLANFGVDTVRATIDVRRLSDGKVLGEFAVTHTGVVEGIESVGSLAVKSDGAVAWIGAARSLAGGRRVIEVHAADASAASDKVLDSSPQIVPNSLRLHGSTLTWRDGAAARRAALR